MNQTTQMHEIANELPEYDCWFSHIFTDSPIINAAIKHTSLISGTVLSNQFRQNSEEYLRKHQLNIDYAAKKNSYDLVVYCSDMIIADRLLKTKTIWVQEGMIDKYTALTTIVKKLKLPTWLTCDTSLNGSTNALDIYCAASEGYKNYFSKNGTDLSKIVVTGIPNYDNCKQYLDNDFPHRDYVLVATTDMRETYRSENRPAFIKKTVEMANGRQMLFKLHPNEKFERAEAEIRRHAPAGTMIFQKGNTNHMIANCSELITQYSTVVYVGIALGKKVHSYFDIEQLNQLVPIQNNGVSSKNIAQVCRKYVEYQGDKKDFLKDFKFEPYQTRQLEEIYA
jgi:hypothetical protein